jgi:predicted RNA-binding protein with PUA-like domain
MQRMSRKHSLKIQFRLSVAGAGRSCWDWWQFRSCLQLSAQLLSDVRSGGYNKPNLDESDRLKYWLMKSEPDVFGIADLERDRTTIWDGVRNYQARNFLKSMQAGDLAFFYHSNTNPPGIVGLMQVVEAEVVDPSQFDPDGEYYDPKSTAIAPRWHTVKVEFVCTFDAQITLARLRELFTPEQLLVVKQGNRLSVIPILDRIAAQILQISKDVMTS